MVRQLLNIHWIFKTLLGLLLASGLFIGLTSTPIGLKISCKLLSVYLPGKIKFSTAQGNLFSDLSLINVSYQDKKQSQELRAQRVHIKWDFNSLLKNKTILIDLLEIQQLQGLETLLPKQGSWPKGIDSTIFFLNGKGKYHLENQDLTINILPFEGMWQQALVEGEINFQQINHQISIDNCKLAIGNNLLLLTHDPKQFTRWHININEPHLLLHNSERRLQSQGEISHQSNATINANVDTQEMQVALSGPIDNHTITINFDFLNDSKTLFFQHALNYKNINDIKGKITLIKPSELIHQYYLHQINIDWQKTEQQLTGTLLAQGEQNDLIKNDFQINNGKVLSHSTVTVKKLFNHINHIPTINRLRGELTGEIIISGPVSQPIIKPALHFNNISATFPYAGVKVKPLEIHIIGDQQQTWHIKGQGQMRGAPGEFSLLGFIKPFEKNNPSQLTITGKNIQCFNNKTYRILASPNIHLVWRNKTLFIDGNIDIPQANIDLDNYNDNLVTKSSDVVVIGAPQPIKPIKVIPNVALRLQKGIQFKGYGMQSDISGKIKITKYKDNVLGEGRITLKNGTYQLPGKTFQIYHGRFLFPPGTLLSNPNLDIQLQSKKQTVLFVQGSLNNPIIHDTGFTEDGNALAQVFNTGTSPFTKTIQSIFGLEEITLQDSKQTSLLQDNPDNSLLQNKDLIIGKKLSDRLYLQYLQNLANTNNTLRLKYDLSDIWSFGIETGNEGQGADLSFSVDRD